MRIQLPVWVLAMSAVLSPGCGHELEEPTVPDHSFIVGGEVTEDYPEVVALYFRESVMGANSMCSGTIINDEWILSAAHCPLTAEDEGGIDPELSSVYIGSDVYGDDVIEVHFDEWYAHPDYNGFNKDVAVFHLEEPSPVEGIPINRDDLDDGFADEVCTFVGFGLSESGTIDGLKRVADIGVTGLFPSVFYYYDAESMTSNGDSGGPALFEFGEGTRVVGVTSWGWDTFGVSTRTDDNAEWIDDYTGGDSDPWPEEDDDTADDDTDEADDDTEIADDDTETADDDVGDDDDQGCSCSSAKRPASTPVISVWVGLALFLILRRRRTGNHAGVVSTSPRRS